MEGRDSRSRRSLCPSSASSSLLPTLSVSVADTVCDTFSVVSGYRASFRIGDRVTRHVSVPSEGSLPVDSFNPDAVLVSNTDVSSHGRPSSSGPSRASSAQEQAHE